jgi:hypothetical protein
VKITLATGRVVSMAQLHQRGTYAGVLAGKFDQRLSRMMIEEITQEAAQHGPAGCRPHVVLPPPAAIAHRLPGVACIAVLESGELRGGSEPYSSVVVAWFQDDFLSPMPEAVAARIRDMDWEKTAVEWCP